MSYIDDLTMSAAQSCAGLFGSSHYLDPNSYWQGAQKGYSGPSGLTSEQIIKAQREALAMARQQELYSSISRDSGAAGSPDFIEGECSEVVDNG